MNGIRYSGIKEPPADVAFKASEYASAKEQEALGCRVKVPDLKERSFLHAGKIISDVHPEGLNTASVNNFKPNLIFFALAIAAGSKNGASFAGSLSSYFGANALLSGYGVNSVPARYGISLSAAYAANYMLSKENIVKFMNGVAFYYLVDQISSGAFDTYGKGGDQNIKTYATQGSGLTAGVLGPKLAPSLLPLAIAAFINEIPGIIYDDMPARKQLQDRYMSELGKLSAQGNIPESLPASFLLFTASIPVFNNITAFNMNRSDLASIK